MKDLFADLLERTRGRSSLAPLLPARFEAVTAVQEPWGEVEALVTARPRGGALPAPSAGWVTAAPPPARSTPAAAHETPAPPPREAVRGVERRVTASTRDVRVPETRAEGPEVPRTPSLDLAALVAEALRAPVPPPVVIEPPPPVVADAAESVHARPPLVPAGAGQARPAPVATVPAMREPGPVRPEPPAIEVRIGRIEVTAAPPPRPAPAVRPSRVPAVGLSLGDYLARRSRR